VIEHIQLENVENSVKLTDFGVAVDGTARDDN
jgi:hypothetical protein